MKTRICELTMELGYVFSNMQPQNTIFWPMKNDVTVV